MCYFPYYLHYYPDTDHQSAEDLHLQDDPILMERSANKTASRLQANPGGSNMPLSLRYKIACLARHYRHCAACIRKILLPTDCKTKFYRP